MRDHSWTPAETERVFGPVSERDWTAFHLALLTDLPEGNRIPREDGIYDLIEAGCLPAAPIRGWTGAPWDRWRVPAAAALSHVFWRLSDVDCPELLRRHVGQWLARRGHAGLWEAAEGALDLTHAATFAINGSGLDARFDPELERRLLALHRETVAGMEKFLDGIAWGIAWRERQPYRGRRLPPLLIYRSKPVRAPAAEAGPGQGT